MAAKTPAGVTVNGKHYRFDSLTLDELEAIEEKCGSAFEDLDLGRASVVKAVVFQFMRRDDPELAIDSVGSITLADLKTATRNGAKSDAD